MNGAVDQVATSTVNLFRCRRRTFWTSVRL